jgi:hypothetical protein
MDCCAITGLEVSAVVCILTVLLRLCVKVLVPSFMLLGGGKTFIRWGLVGALQVIRGVPLWSLETPLSSFSLYFLAMRWAVLLYHALLPWYAGPKQWGPTDHGLNPLKLSTKINFLGWLSQMFAIVTEGYTSINPILLTNNLKIWE